MPDLLIRNGTVIDGTGNPGYRADIAVTDGTIVKVAPQITGGAARVIDAAGLTVTPGFIDTHSHYDFIALLPCDCALLLEQGITTQLTGNCGDSLAPYPASVIDPQIPPYLSEQQVQALREACRDPGTFMAHAAGQTYGVNTAFLVGHNSLRLHAVGPGSAEATPAQLGEMKDMVRLAMESGMFGFSSGLAYAPSCYANTEELAELAGAAARYGGIYASHIRDEGDRVFDAVSEAIEIGERSGASVLISHIKIMGDANRGKAARVLELIRKARERGLNVFADQYPYEAASAPLLAQIPPKYLARGREDALRLIADPVARRQIEHSIFEETEDFKSCLAFAGYGGSVIAEAAKTPRYVGLSLADAAQTEGREPVDLMMDLLIENGGEVRCIFFTQYMDDILAFLASPFVFTGDDWAVLGSRPDPETRGGAHPRATAAFVRKLELARDRAALTPEACIYRMTGGPAQALGLAGRGFIREGYAADLCVLAYDSVHAESDYRHPFRPNRGIRYVIVNGGVAVENGRCTGSRYGKAILKDIQRKEQP